MASNKYLEATREVLRGVMGPFMPTVAMSVSYGNVKLTNGCELKEIVAANAPRVEIGGESNELYTLIMIDPDAPNPNEPRLQELVSWIVTNIPGGNSCTQGTEIEPYVGPHPEIGVHRYILVLYRQQMRLAIDNLASRVHFNARGFANRHNLGNPVGIAYFYVRKQPNKTKTKRN